MNKESLFLSYFEFYFNSFMIRYVSFMGIFVIFLLYLKVIFREKIFLLNVVSFWVYCFILVKFVGIFFVIVVLKYLDGVFIRWENVKMLI